MLAGPGPPPGRPGDLARELALISTTIVTAVSRSTSRGRRSPARGRSCPKVWPCRQVSIECVCVNLA
jgi:hypothetical protein